MEEKRGQQIILVFTIAITALVPDCKGHYGKHDLFTSLVQLKQLWRNDQIFVKNLEDAIPTLETLLSAAKR